jgi:hypothetical protein
MQFPSDYFAARDRFRAAAARLGWACEAHPIAARGPTGEELTIDTALSPAAAGSPVLVVSGGVHGVEGPFGSAVQLAALDGWAKDRPPAGVRCVFVHAVNPFGYAHGRRFDEDNVDPNRNFLLPGEEYTGCPPAYAQVEAALNPRSPPRWWESFTLTALREIARFGYAGLKQAVAGGQYAFPKGLFYGGTGPSVGTRIVREHFARWVGDAPTGVQLDFHTGLGKWGTYKLLLDPPFTPGQLAKAEALFGRDAIEVTDPAGTAYRTRGGFDVWCAAQLPGRDFVAVCAEFGTYGNLAVLGGVRAENRATHWCGPGDPRVRRARDRLWELFCPASPRWRTRVVDQGVDLIRKATAGLTRAG